MSIGIPITRRDKEKSAVAHINASTFNQTAMSATPTQRRLAVTPGKWKVRGRYDVYAAVGTYIGTTRANNPEEMPENFRAIDEANATLIADAGTTYNACDMLPSELLVKLRATATELKAASMVLRQGGMESYTDDADAIDAFLSTLNLPKP